MKKITKLFVLTIALGAVTAFASPALACDKCKILPKKHIEAADSAKTELYAHPTLFSKNKQIYATPESNKYIIGGKAFKAKNKMGVKNKENVYVQAFSKDLLSMMEEKQFGKLKCGLFNPKKPILRSELAFALSEGLNIKAVAKVKKYSDVPADYWAADWIAKAYDSGLMIGYPDNNFKPEQSITKAEVFAVIAQMIDVKTDDSSIAKYKNKEVQHIPNWAVSAAKEVASSNLLEKLPDQSKIIDSEYLSKEQVAYLVGALRSDFRFYQHLGKDKNAPGVVKDFAPAYLNIKLADRISARHSNIGDKFSAKTIKETMVAGKTFPAGSKVVGEVVSIQRPGLKEPGFVRVKFIEISNDSTKVEFPKVISEAQADKIKNPNFIARLFAMPISGTMRILGVTFRTVGTTINVVGNGVEEMGDEISSAIVETASLQPVSGLKSFGSAFVTTGTTIYNALKLVASGAFGVIYEITDEIKYVILPSASNNSSLNPGEELIIIF